MKKGIGGGTGYAYGYREPEGYYKTVGGYGPDGESTGGVVPVPPPDPYLLFDWKEALVGGESLPTEFVNKGTGAAGNMSSYAGANGLVRVIDGGPGGTPAIYGNEGGSLNTSSRVNWGQAAFDTLYKTNGGFTIAWWQQSSLPLGSSQRNLIQWRYVSAGQSTINDLRRFGPNEDGAGTFGAFHTSGSANLLEGDVACSPDPITDWTLCFFVHDYNNAISGVPPSANPPVGRMNYYAVGNGPLVPCGETGSSPQSFIDCGVDPAPCAPTSYRDGTVGVWQGNCTDCVGYGSNVDVVNEWIMDVQIDRTNTFIMGGETEKLGKFYIFSKPLTDAERAYLVANPEWPIGDPPDLCPATPTPIGVWTDWGAEVGVPLALSSVDQGGYGFDIITWFEMREGSTVLAGGATMATTSWTPQLADVGDHVVTVRYYYDYPQGSEPSCYVDDSTPFTVTVSEGV